MRILRNIQLNKRFQNRLKMCGSLLYKGDLVGLSKQLQRARTRQDIENDQQSLRSRTQFIRNIQAENKQNLIEEAEARGLHKD